jgi:hypothetical protein
MSIPDEVLAEFTTAYYDNCKERRMWNDPELTKDEYWKIWVKDNEHKEART